MEAIRHLACRCASHTRRSDLLRARNLPLVRNSENHTGHRLLARARGLLGRAPYERRSEGQSRPVRRTLAGFRESERTAASFFAPRTSLPLRTRISVGRKTTLVAAISPKPAALERLSGETDRG